MERACLQNKGHLLGETSRDQQKGFCPGIFSLSLFALARWLCVLLVFVAPKQLWHVKGPAYLFLLQFLKMAAHRGYCPHFTGEVFWLLNVVSFNPWNNLYDTWMPVFLCSRFSDKPGDVKSDLLQGRIQAQICLTIRQFPQPAFAASVGLLSREQISVCTMTKLLTQRKENSIHRLPPPSTK